MNVRAICEGHSSLPLSVAEAVPLFTPEGERRWAGSSWDPVYAIPEAAQDDTFVRELEAGYDAFLEGWRQEILSGLAGGPPAVDETAPE